MRNLVEGTSLMDDECFQAKWTFKDEMGIQVEIYSK